MGGSAPPVVEGRQEGSLCGTELLRCPAPRAVELPSRRGVENATGRFPWKPGPPVCEGVSVQDREDSSTAARIAQPMLDRDAVSGLSHRRGPQEQPELLWAVVLSSAGNAQGGSIDAFHGHELGVQVIEVLVGRDDHCVLYRR